MMNRIVDDQITLIPYYRNDDISLLWYQDRDVCKQVDNTDQIYDVTKLHKMYDHLTSHGSCYYVQYEGGLVGDVTLQDNSELSIVISKEYQNLQIGRRCISEMIQLAKEKKMVKVTAQIYP
ncbi:GNAT family N-acetyltransferase, partial [Streptococcus sp. HMSC065C01]